MRTIATAVLMASVLTTIPAPASATAPLVGAAAAIEACRVQTDDGIGFSIAPNGKSLGDCLEMVSGAAIVPLVADAATGAAQPCPTGGKDPIQPESSAGWFAALSAWFRGTQAADD